jgi:hypothetical protein
MKKLTITLLALCVSIASGAAIADGTRADSHAPIGVMGDHIHEKGEWMFSYRFMTMDMEGNLQGSDAISPDTIVTTEANRFFGMPGQPPTLRIVPLEMTMDMHMLGLMYAPSDRITLMFMTSYSSKDMDHVTYMGGMGTTVLGNFTTETSGWGDTSVSGLISLINNGNAKVHATVGVSLPTGSTDETGQILTPMNMQPTVRLPYPMQLGSGSYDPIIGLTYAGHGERFAWGAQWRSTFRVQENDDDYELGDLHKLTGWLSYLWSDAVSTSIRVEQIERHNISGMDPQIMGPVQTADPGRHELSGTDIAVGLNIAGQHNLDGWRLALEYAVPVSQDVDGPQLETDAQLLLGIQKSW